MERTQVVRDPVRRTRGTLPPAARVTGHAGYLLLVLALAGSVIFLWTWLPPSPSLWHLLLLLAHLALTFAIQRQLAYAFPSLGSVWPYRIAFLLSVATGLVLWLRGVVATTPLGLWPLASTFFGALSGGLLLSAVDEGLWEDSYPPPPDIADAVHQHHLRLLGPPLPDLPGKRLFDLILAMGSLILSAPLWLAGILLIWFEDPGPIFFIKNSVGKGGINFRQIKFRSMIRHAEEETGPIATWKDDPRTLIIGRFLRRTTLDELPQLLNVLRGEMSFVGPRPLRTVVIYEFLKVLPQFAERHQVQPGLAGISQVIGGYYVTPLQRLRFDRLYIRHRSLLFDLKLFLHSAIVVLWIRWLPEEKRRNRHW